MTRPSSYKSEYDEKVIEWLSDGKTLASFADSLGVSRVTLWDWKQSNETFSNAIKKGREIATALHSEQFLLDNLEKQGLNHVIAVLYCRNVLKLKTRDDAPPPPTPPDNFDYSQVINDD